MPWLEIDIDISTLFGVLKPPAVVNLVLFVLNLFFALLPIQEVPWNLSDMAGHETRLICYASVARSGYAAWRSSPHGVSKCCTFHSTVSGLSLRSVRT